MAAIARVLARALPQAVLARALPQAPFEIEPVKLLALFCGAGLLISLVMIAYGFDISAGFF